MEEPQFRVQLVKEKSFHTKEEAKAYYRASLLEHDGMQVTIVQILDDGTQKEHRNEDYDPMKGVETVPPFSKKEKSYAYY